MFRDERLVRPPTLEENLRPVLARMREGNNDPSTNYAFVREWFTQHEENLAVDITDLAFVCALPNPERVLLTYPVVGNWVLDKMRQFQPQTPHQEQAYSLLRRQVSENRFTNSHMQKYYDDNEGFERRYDELNSILFANPDESMPLNDLMTQISREVYEEVSEGELSQPKYDNLHLGHALEKPVDSYRFLMWRFATLVEDGQTSPLDVSIMIVDDDDPKQWYERMIGVGFKDIPGQQGYFEDCETALEALRQGHYDVILTDIELGEGKMEGLEFVDRAYGIQLMQGIEPRISVFSYNDEKLEEAEERFRRSTWKRKPWERQKPEKLFHQVNYNKKSTFSATNFRMQVSSLLEREQKYGLLSQSK